MGKKEEKPQIDSQLAQARREVSQAEKAYQRGVRVTQSVPILKRLAFGLWAVVDGILLLLFFYFVFGYLISGQFSDRQSVAEFFAQIDVLHDESLERAPIALLTSESIVMDFEDARYDFYAEIENGNEDWYATFRYGFETADGERTELQSGFVFPGEVRPLIQVNQLLEGSPNQAELIVEEVTWYRLDAHEIEDVSTWMQEHQNFTVSASEYGETIEFAEDSVVRSVFTLTNNSPYNYWNAPFWLILERGGSVVGVNQFTIAGFEANETREVIVNWFGRAPSSAQEVTVYPLIDYFDEGVYMDQPTGEDVDSRQ